MDRHFYKYEHRQVLLDELASKVESKALTLKEALTGAYDLGVEEGYEEGKEVAKERNNDNGR